MGGDVNSKTRWEYKNVFKRKKRKRQQERGECYQQPESVFSEISCSSLAPHILQESLLSLCSVYKVPICPDFFEGGIFPQGSIFLQSTVIFNKKGNSLRQYEGLDSAELEEI